ncbi:AAA family ATPase [Streptomyces sp. NPDC007984]|uniref:AAA family ATPase n=1 Tax=Streptomyces sp. NPDC007984 TaxID=3364801 RepID=UPI0036E3473F
MTSYDVPPPPLHVRAPFAQGTAAGARGPVLGPFADDAQWPPEPPEDETLPDPEPRALVLRPASEIRIRPVRWLWDTTPEGAPPTSHGRIPLYSLAIAAGGPGLGKSQFAVWLTARITRGELPGELYGKPRGVIYAATEDSWVYTIAPRLIAAGANLELVFRVEVKDDERPRARLTLPTDTSLIGHAAERYSVALLVADPLLSLIDRGINDYRAAEVREALEPLVACAERHHFTILGLAHFTKSGGADPLARLAGSGAFGQLIRSFIAFAREDADGGDERFVMSLEKNNLGRLGLPSHSYVIQPVTVDTEDGPSYVSRFVLGPETSTSVRDVMREEITPSGDKAENDEVRMWLRDYLTDLGGAADSGDLIKDAEKRRYSRTTVYRAKTKLGLITKQSGFGKARKSVWYLPEAAPTEEAKPPTTTP